MGDGSVQQTTDNRVIRTLYHSGQAGQVLFTPLPIRNITPDGRSARNSFHGVPDGGNSDFDRKFFTVLSDPNGFEMIDDFTQFQTVQDFRNFIWVMGGNEHAHGLSNSLASRIAVHSLGT